MVFDRSHEIAATKIEPHQVTPSILPDNSPIANAFFYELNRPKVAVPNGLAKRLLGGKFSGAELPDPRTVAPDASVIDVEQ